MPMFVDIHDAPGVTADAAARAHLVDLHVQASHGVDYVKYWLNEKAGKVYCLVSAPNAEAADAVHREAHGMSAGRIMEVTPEMAETFLGIAEVNKDGAVIQPGSVEHDTGTRTILITDIVGSTNMTQRLGDELALTILQAHDRIVREALATLSGREVKHTGDGIMAVFHSAAHAVRCGMAMQNNVARYRSEHPDESFQMRIGVAAGEPIEHHNDFYGSAVQLAARLCAHADPDHILMSNAVAELCMGKSLPLKAVGPVALKGFDEPVQVHCILPLSEN